MVVWGLGLGSWIGFFGLGFQLKWFVACGVGPSGFFGVGTLFTNIEKQTWEKNFARGK